MKCAKCGTTATVYNKSGIPVCSRHTNEKINPPKCPDCKKGKFDMINHDKITDENLFRCDNCGFEIWR